MDEAIVGLGICRPFIADIGGLMPGAGAVPTTRFIELMFAVAVDGAPTAFARYVGTTRCCEAGALAFADAEWAEERTGWGTVIRAVAATAIGVAFLVV